MRHPRRPKPARILVALTSAANPSSDLAAHGRRGAPHHIACGSGLARRRFHDVATGLRMISFVRVRSPPGSQSGRRCPFHPAGRGGSIRRARPNRSGRSLDLGSRPRCQRSARSAVSVAVAGLNRTVRWRTLAFLRGGPGSPARGDRRQPPSFLSRRQAERDETSREHRRQILLWLRGAAPGNARPSAGRSARDGQVDDDDGIRVDADELGHRQTGRGAC